MELWTIKQIFGVLLVITGIFDAIKYSLQALKIKKKKSADTMSRKFVLMAIGNDLIKIIYSMLIMDIYIFLSSILALVCMFHLWAMVYIYYPYRKRNCPCFKRPNLLLFTWNACIPNKWRKHL